MLNEETWAVGAPAPGGQYAHYKEDLYLYGQRAFGMPPDRHYRMLHLAGEEKPPIVVLSVVVIEAEGLEAKDANGYDAMKTELDYLRTDQQIHEERCQHFGIFQEVVLLRCK
ncbi:hypothetical protein GEV33_001709 [Tenebrio molitor]|uniref:Uncharacterized protein n=1 Tax=Tenebrio molitor TaxID=7067 RepID=A0A8J6HVJ8_TENMO|nr:hypothetical protein GEV33_001709 [Tenebrio molitor]